MLSSSKSPKWENNNSSFMADWLESSFSLHLDLYNLDSSEAEESPYILTSPRSLEACSKLEIKPVELLPKDLMQFEEKCLLTGQPLRNAKMLHQEHEQQRLVKLRQCCHMRERIIQEQDDQDNLRHDVQSLSVGSDLRNSVKAKDDYKFGQGDNRKTSLQTNKRPTSATTTDQLYKFSALRLSPERPTPTSRANRTFSPLSKHQTTCTIPSNRHIMRQTPTLVDTVAPAMRSKVNQNERPLSACTSRQSVRSRKSSPSASSLISEQDQKILELLEKKYKDEKEIEKMRSELRLAWDDQRQGEEMSKIKNEIQRRQNLAKANWRRQKKKDRNQRQRQLQDEKETEDAKLSLQYQDMRHERLVKEQDDLLLRQIQEKKLEEANRKNRQEKVLRRHEEDLEEYRKMESHDTVARLEKGEELRRQKENKKAMSCKWRNQKARVRHSSSKDSVDKDNEMYLTTLKESIILKQDRTKRTLGNHQWLQDHELRLNSEKEAALQEKSQRLRQEIEDENHQWQRQLMYHSLVAHDRAAQQANQTVQKKASKVRQARRSRELTHQELKKRVEEDETHFQEFVKTNLAYKDMKSQSLAAQKQDTIKRSRVVAMESAKLRDQIRQQYQGSFDKMVQRANHQLVLGKGPQMSTKNATTFTLT